MFSPRTIRRGFTLIELLVVIGVSSIVLGGLGALYVYTASQIGDAMAEIAATDQVATAFESIEWSVRNATLCEAKTVGGVTALRCKMPREEIDINGDGVPESYAPASLDKKGLEKYGTGKRVWYYLSDATGLVGASGSTLWRRSLPTIRTR